ncbi:hypothetical protein J6Y73_01525 [bacterium]|nr:hypothetical protein [bacterium]
MQIDGKTYEQIIEYFKKDNEGFRGLALNPSFDMNKDIIPNVLNRLKMLGFPMPKRMPSSIRECLFIDILKKKIDVGQFDNFGIRIYSICSFELLDKILDYFYN